MIRACQNRDKKAGLPGLFCCAVFAALMMTGIAAAAPLAIDVTEAQAGYNTLTNEPLITFKMSEASREAFAELTRANVGRKCAIRIDGKTVSAPIIREPILGGAGQIAGQFTVRQVREIAARLKSGAARLEVEIVE